MASIDLRNQNEVYLGGTYFRIRGRVRLTNIAVTPNPVIFGDTSRQSGTQVMSQYVQSSSAGGSGVFKAGARTDTDRVWKSRAETRYRDQLTLPPLSWDIGKPDGLSTEDCLLLIAYRDNVYSVWAGGKVHRWDDAAAEYSGGIGTDGWSALLATLTPAAIYDGIVYQDHLFFACDTALHQLDADGTWQAHASTPAQYLEVWDDKLWRVGQSNGEWRLWWTNDTPDNTTTWDTWTQIESRFPYGVIPTQLITFRDVEGLSVLAAITNVGLWLYDATNAKWRQTEIRIPEMPFGQRSRACLFRDGKLYFTTGNIGLVSVQPGNPFIATPTGLDLEDGVPAEDNGKITQVAADFNWVLALLDSTEEADEDETIYGGLASPFDTPEWNLRTGLTTLRAYNGSWHVLWESPNEGAPSYTILVSGAFGKRRVYWGASGKVFWQTLPSSVHNPRHNPTAEFAAGPVEHVTPWFDFATSGQDKVMGHLEMLTAGCSATETISLFYETDFSGTWIELDDALGSNVVATNGRHTFLVGGKEGTACRFWRLKLTLARGTDASLSPLVEYWLVDFMRRLPATYGYVVQLDLTESNRTLTPAQQLAALKTLADPDQTPEMVQFAYEDDLGGRVQTHYGVISRIQGEEESGVGLRGKGSYHVSIMAPYLGDSE